MPLATIEELRTQLPSGSTNQLIQRLQKFAGVPGTIMESISKMVLSENWGPELYALEKYLAVHIAWAIEQGNVTFSGTQFYMSAGSLQTRYGTPLYLVFERNTKRSSPPWFLITAGAEISAPDLPRPPEIPKPSDMQIGSEIILMHDHILGENANRVKFLKDTPPVAQMCAVAGAIQWSLYRGLQFPYWYFGRMQYLVPVYLTSRENITQAPDLVAPIDPSGDNLRVRTVLEPHMPYPNARVAVRRHDQLPAWLLDCWNTNAQKLSKSTLEDPEHRKEA